MALVDYGAVTWISSDSAHFLFLHQLTATLATMNSTGLAAWRIKSGDPTSAYTHPKMFDYFLVRQQQYIFHRMVSCDHLVIFNTPLIHSQVMLPWVQCALSTECITPKGAQNTGCHSERRPLYLYSGCHRYEVSALNVVLGKVFQFDDARYISDDVVFGAESDVTTTSPQASSKVR